jgi:predicted nucleic acid-binding protein
MSDEGHREFVDTNVLVYAHDRSAGAKQAQAAALLAGLWDSGLGCLSVQVLQEFFVAVTRKVPHPLESTAAESLVRDLTNWAIFTPDADDVLAAIALHRRARIAFWDAMVLHSAAAMACDVVWSEDLNPRQSYDGVTVRNPFAS